MLECQESSWLQILLLQQPGMAVTFLPPTLSASCMGGANRTPDRVPCGARALHAPLPSHLVLCQWKYMRFTSVCVHLSWRTEQTPRPERGKNKFQAAASAKHCSDELHSKKSQKQATNVSMQYFCSSGPWEKQGCWEPWCYRDKGTDSEWHSRCAKPERCLPPGQTKTLTCNEVRWE